MTEQTERLKKWIAGLREIANFAEEQPSLFEDIMNMSVYAFVNTPEEMIQKTKLLGKSEKVVCGGYYNMRRFFGPHYLDICIQRDQLCKKVQTGTQMVSAPDPEAIRNVPTIMVEEPVYEWVCPESILALGKKDKD